MQSPKEVLKQNFGYEEFRQGQNEIINSIVNKKNVLAIMPTGAGKSLCYQIPAIINKKKTIVKTFDMYGREISFTKHSGFVIQVFSDHTVSKTYRF